MTATSLPPNEIRKRILHRLLEKHDPVKSRHKPLSLLRPEIRRSAEQLLEQEGASLPAEEREPMLDEILGDVPGIGPLEELFRDESVSEFIVLTYNQVIRREGASWMPTTNEFRDADHYRDTLKKLLRTAEPIGDVPTTSDGGADALLANGFRLITILPPRVLNISPLAVFRRPTCPIETTPFLMKPPTPIGSGVKASSIISRHVDSWEKLRQRITERFIQRLAANGVYDISALPAVELRRVIASYVAEFNDVEKLQLDGAGQERLTLEIVTGINRKS